MTARSVKGSMSRFLAILSITALGAGFLAGLLATSPDMRQSANDYFTESGMYDYYIQSTLGFSDENIEHMKELSYVESVTAVEQYDEFVEDSEGEKLETRKYLLDFSDDSVGRLFTLTEGRMPEKENECAVEIPNIYGYSTEIGEVFKDEDGKEYTVTGIVKTPMYISANGEPSSIGKGSVTLAMYIPQTDKKEKVYTACYLNLDMKSSDTFSEEYENELDMYAEKLEKFADEEAALRTAEIKAEAEEALAEGRAEYEKSRRDAEKELADGKKEIDENRAELDRGAAEINSSAADIAEGKVKIDDGIAQIDDGIVSVKDGLSQISGSLNEVESGITQAENGISGLKETITALEDQLQYLPPEEQTAVQQQIAALREQLEQLEGQLTQLAAAEQQLSMQKNQLEEKLNTLNSERSSLVTKKKQLTEGEKLLAEKKKQVMEGYSLLENAQAEYEKGKKEAERRLADAEKELEDAQKEIDEIEDAVWYIADRLDTTGISSYKSDVDKVAAIARIFPIFFFLVAALVVLTTMTRMIEEDRQQIGTLKSLGYHNRTIRNYYLSYGAAATVIGCFGGMIAGFYALPKVISEAYGMMYNLPETDTPFKWGMAVTIFLITLICIMLTILAACRHELRERPAMLMQPKAPAAGKRILLERLTPVWSRMKFTHKVTMRNLFRYKKRFFMTVIGVAGCFALLMTGFGVRDSISDIVEVQYGQLNTYDISISIESGDWQPDSEYISNPVYLSSENVTAENDGNSEAITLAVPDDAEAMKRYIHLRDRKSEETVDMKDGRIYLSEKLGELLDIEKGDSVELKRDGDTAVECEVGGFFENYVGYVAYMTDSTYENVFGDRPEMNTVYAEAADDADSDEIIRNIMKQDHVSYAMATESIIDTFSDSIKSIDYIVGVIILSAGALSMIVLYNLTNINICERKKELATIKVLGFHNREVYGYIFREIYLLTVIGTVAGIPLGFALHRFIILTAEVGGMMFGRQIYPLSIVSAVAITMIFTVLVTFIMRRMIKRIDMVESMKANE